MGDKLGGRSAVSRTGARSAPDGTGSRICPRSPVDVRAIRKASGLTQQAFASTYGFTLGALRDWEQGRKQPERTARVLLRVIANEPDAVARVVSEAGSC